jgi:hypothetical protein
MALVMVCLLNHMLTAERIVATSTCFAMQDASAQLSAASHIKRRTKRRMVIDEWKSKVTQPCQTKLQHTPHFHSQTSDIAGLDRYELDLVQLGGAAFRSREDAKVGHAGHVHRFVFRALFTSYEIELACFFRP